MLELHVRKSRENVRVGGLWSAIAAHLLRRFCAADGRVSAAAEDDDDDRNGFDTEMPEEKRRKHECKSAW